MAHRRLVPLTTHSNQRFATDIYQDDDKGVAGRDPEVLGLLLDLLITQMQAQYQQTQSLNAQYQEATSLNDQLLLQEFQLKGVQLGYTALHLKQQAFKATIQAAEAGTLPVPGKPQAEVAQPQPA